MPTNLTDQKVSATYNQLLHVDGGPDTQEKVVHSGTGVPTALKIGTESVSVDNVRIDGNTISTTEPNTDLVLAPTGGVEVNDIRIHDNTIEITESNTDLTLKLHDYGIVNVDAHGLRIKDNLFISENLISNALSDKSLVIEPGLGKLNVLGTVSASSYETESITINDNFIYSKYPDRNIEISVPGSTGGIVSIPTFGSKINNVVFENWRIYSEFSYLVLGKHSLLNPNEPPTELDPYYVVVDGNLESNGIISAQKLDLLDVKIEYSDIKPKRGTLNIQGDLTIRNKLQIIIDEPFSNDCIFRPIPGYSNAAFNIEYKTVNLGYKFSFTDNVISVHDEELILRPHNGISPKIILDAPVYINGNTVFNSSVSFSSPTTAGNPLIRGENVSLPSGVNLSSVTDTGFYRLGAAVVDGPPNVNVDDGQLIVSRGGTSITQIVTDINTGDMWTRSGSPSEIGGSGSWSPWLKVTTSFFESSELYINNGDSVSVQHSFGQQPKNFQGFIRCKFAEYGYVVGEEIAVSSVLGCVVSATDTHLSIQTSSNGVHILDKITGNQVQITNGSWRYVLRAWK